MDCQTTCQGYVMGSTFGSGDPNGKGLPEWPAFDKNKRLTMELGVQLGPRLVADDAKFEVFEKFFAKQQAQ